MKQKFPVWLFYFAIDGEKKLVLGAWTVMQKSVLRPWDWNLTVKSVLNWLKTKPNPNL